MTLQKQDKLLLKMRNKKVMNNSNGDQGKSILCLSVLPPNTFDFLTIDFFLLKNIKNVHQLSRLGLNMSIDLHINTYPTGGLCLGEW